MGEVPQGYMVEQGAVTMRKKGYPKPDGLFLRDGESHNVWKPGSAEELRQRTTSPPESAPAWKGSTGGVGGGGGGSGGGFFQRANLWERQKEVVDRVQATQQALKQEMRELATSSLSLNIPPEPSPHTGPLTAGYSGGGGGGGGGGKSHHQHSFRAVSMQVLDKLRKDKVRESIHFHDVVKMCLEEQKLHTLSSGPLHGSTIQLQQNTSSPLHFFPPGSPQTPWLVSGAPTPTSAVPPPHTTPKLPAPPPPAPPSSTAPPPPTPRGTLPITPRTPRPRAVPISIQRWREILQKEQGLDAISENTEVSSNADHSPPAPTLKPCKRKNSVSTVV